MQFNRLFAVMLAVVLFAPPLRAQPPNAVMEQPTDKDRSITQGVARLIEYAHLKQFKINADIARRMHKLYIEGFDPKKLFFLASDVAEFGPFETMHDKFVRDGDIEFAMRVHQRFLERVVERNEWAQKLAGEKYDFSKDDTIVFDNKSAEYAKSPEEAKARWKSWVKWELINLVVDGTKEEEARERIRKRYRNLVRFTRQIDKDEILERYLTALTMSFDPHSTYMSPKSQEEFEISMKLQLQGIGALLSSEDGKTIIKEIIPGGAADKDKRLKPGDQITGVGQGEGGEVVDIDEMKLGNVVKMIRGEAGTTVRLEVVPADAKKRVVYVLNRQKITLSEKEAKGEILEVPRQTNAAPRPQKGLPQPAGAKIPTYRVGVIKLPSFYADNDAVRNGAPDAKSATGDVRRILEDFNRQGVDGVIVDLRMDGGGLLHEAIGVTGLFIDEGPVVQVKDYNGKTRAHFDEAPGVAYSGPLIVLVNKFSASASEIFAGAIQDYHRGLIVGDSSTHGKGSVQQIIDLGEKMPRLVPNDRNLGALKVTLQMFYRVNGDSTQNRGVLSDIVLPSVTDQERWGESKLDYALDFDHINPIAHADSGLVTPDVVQKLRNASMERRAKSEELGKLEKRVDRFRELANQKVVTFNESKLRQQKKERGDLSDEEDDEDNDNVVRDPNKKKVEKKFGHDAYDREAMAILGDYIRLQDGKLAGR